MDTEGVHVVYADASSYQLRRAYRPLGSVSWSFETVPVTPAGLVAVALDEAGGVHVGLSTDSYGIPNYAYRSPAGGWTTEALTAGSIPTFDLIVLGGAVHVMSYGLHLSRAVAASEWTTEPAPWFAGASLAGTADGTLHAVFTGLTGIQHARRMECP